MDPKIKWLAAAKRVVMKLLVLSRHLHSFSLAAAGCRIKNSELGWQK